MLKVSLMVTAAVAAILAINPASAVTAPKAGTYTETTLLPDTSCGLPAGTILTGKFTFKGTGTTGNFTNYAANMVGTGTPPDSEPAIAHITYSTAFPTTSGATWTGTSATTIISDDGSSSFGTATFTNQVVFIDASDFLMDQKSSLPAGCHSVSSLSKD